MQFELVRTPSNGLYGIYSSLESTCELFVSHCLHWFMFRPLQSSTHAAVPGPKCKQGQLKRKVRNAGLLLQNVARNNACLESILKINQSREGSDAACEVAVVLCLHDNTRICTRKLHASASRTHDIFDVCVRLPYLAYSYCPAECALSQFIATRNSIQGYTEFSDHRFLETLLCSTISIAGIDRQVQATSGR